MLRIYLVINIGCTYIDHDYTGIAGELTQLCRDKIQQPYRDM